MKDLLLSGDDTKLKNVWDGICVQVQFQEFIAWDVYEETIKVILSDEVNNLSDLVKKSIWLQTDAGFDWAFDAEESKEILPILFDEDVVEYIFKTYILKKAADWTNDRVRSYFDRCYLD